MFLKNQSVIFGSDSLSLLVVGGWLAWYVRMSDLSLRLNFSSLKIKWLISVTNLMLFKPSLANINQYILYSSVIFVFETTHSSYNSEIEGVFPHIFFKSHCYSKTYFNKCVADISQRQIIQQKQTPSLWKAERISSY